MKRWKTNDRRRQWSTNFGPQFMNDRIHMKSTKINISDGFSIQTDQISGHNKYILKSLCQWIFMYMYMLLWGLCQYEWIVFVCVRSMQYWFYSFDCVVCIPNSAKWKNIHTRIRYQVVNQQMVYTKAISITLKMNRNWRKKRSERVSEKAAQKVNWRNDRSLIHVVHFFCRMRSLHVHDFFFHFIPKWS